MVARLLDTYIRVCTKKYTVVQRHCKRWKCKRWKIKELELGWKLGYLLCIRLRNCNCIVLRIVTFFYVKCIWANNLKCNCLEYYLKAARFVVGPHNTLSQSLINLSTPKNCSIDPSGLGRSTLETILYILLTGQWTWAIKCRVACCNKILHSSSSKFTINASLLQGRVNQLLQ